MRQVVLFVLLYCSAVAAFSFQCADYTFSRASKADGYVYRLSYGDIPADSLVAHLRDDTEKVALPFHARNLMIKKKQNHDELARCIYPIEMPENKVLQGTPLFQAPGYSCPILVFSGCNVMIQERQG